MTPTLAGWVLRDLALVLVFALLGWALTSWYTATGWVLAAIAGAVTGFIATYAICYAVHEWGHLIGARATGSHMPLNGYGSALIGSFDIAAHSERQFLALSWGGVAGYLLVATIAVSLYVTLPLDWFGAGMAVGGAAFVVQSLAVDLPQIFKVLAGDDPLTTNARGASGAVILRRTAQTWLPLAALLMAWNVLA